MSAVERFRKYIHISTGSDGDSPTCPSTQVQMGFAKVLVEEMKELGICDARVDEHGYVYGYIPANVENQPAIGLIAHMDTVNSVPVEPMNERIVENYDGGDIPLANGDVIRAADYAALQDFVGSDLIVTDGNTILGADDKAGIAEIMAACEKIIGSDMPHGKICIGFTPDEEIGRGADLFNVADFGADFAYTVDGGPMPEIEYENFNAATAKISVHGRAIHPGSAKNRMINSQLVAMELCGMLPPFERPEHTEGYEGFYHLDAIHGSEELTEMVFIIRDHDKAKFEARKETMRRIAAYLNEKYPAGTVELTLTDSYFNMVEVLKDHMECVDRAYAAMSQAGYTPVSVPIRGGTDGARLSFMGLPCPNLPTGAINAHGRHETLCVRQMNDCVEVILNLVRAKV